MSKYFRVFLYDIILYNDDSFFIIINSHYYFYKHKHNSISIQQ